MNIPARFLPLAAAMLLSGCLSIPQTSIDQWRAAQSHHFANITPAQFETALELVFDAAHPGDYQLRPVAGGAIAERHWSVYVVLGYASGLEHWTIHYAPAGDGVDATADLVNVPSGAWPPNANGIERPDNPATYEILWSRLDYVLGKRRDWVSCQEYSQALRHRSLDPNQDWGLCGGMFNRDVVPRRLAG